MVTQSQSREVSCIEPSLSITPLSQPEVGPYRSRISGGIKQDSESTHEPGAGLDVGEDHRALDSASLCSLSRNESCGLSGFLRSLHFDCGLCTM